MWVLTRHGDIRAMLADTRFSSDRNHSGFPPVNENEDANAPIPRSMITMDPPDHTQARRSVLGEFTVKRIAAMRPRVQEIVDECIDTMLAGPGPVDLVQALSLPVPSLVICELLGVPYEDHEYFQARSTKLISRETEPADVQRAIGELAAYLARLIVAKEREPADDLLSRQIAKQKEAGAVDHEALVGTAFLLLVAGHETTANMISLGTLTLLENPEHQAAIRQDPSRTPAMVEEMLRYFTIVELAALRVATEDVELGGVLIRAGDGVVGLSHTGNRDPDVFEAPDLFDIDRGDRNHLAFGYGPHQCLGQNLARLELQIVFDTLVRRVPDLRLAVPAADLPFKNDANIFGIHELPVTR